MPNNFVGKSGKNYILQSVGSRILAESSTIEGLVKDINTLKKNDGLIGGEIYPGVPSETKDYSLNGEEHTLFWELYNKN